MTSEINDRLSCCLVRALSVMLIRWQLRASHIIFNMCILHRLLSCYWCRVLLLAIGTIYKRPAVWNPCTSSASRGGADGCGEAADGDVSDDGAAFRNKMAQFSSDVRYCVSPWVPERVWTGCLSRFLLNIVQSIGLQVNNYLSVWD
jgi:hypothetical protein